MNDWLRELDATPKKVKYTEGLPTALTKLTEPLQSVKEETNSQHYKMAINKLLIIAEEQEWPLSDLQDWYKNDLADVAGMDLVDVRRVVHDYIQNIDLCRGEGYKNG